MDQWWLVFDRLGEKVVHRTPSWTDAFRVARRRTGGRVSLRQGPEYGVTVIGSLATCTVVTVVGNRRLRNVRGTNTVESGSSRHVVKASRTRPSTTVLVGHPL